MSKLTSVQYWQGAIASRAGKPKSFPLLDDIAPYLPVEAGASFLEIGCAPGHTLAEACSRHDYEAHGVDYASDPESVEAVLRARGVRVGRIDSADFFSWSPGRKYDVVASFGFVEHFDNVAEVVDRHFALVRPGGVVVISFPHFAGGQKVLHWLFDRENLGRHNTTCMNLPFLEAAAVRNNAEILCARYTGGQYAFFYEEQRRTYLGKVMRKMTHWTLRQISRALFNRIWPQGVNPVFSPYLIAVYRAPSTSTIPRKS